MRAPLAALDRGRWPSREDLNALAAGRPFRFAPPAAASAAQYESAIAATGDIPTRDNWHDLFNALQWLAFPRLKAAINAGHLAHLAPHARGPRPVPRDVLTMVDESGVLVASEDPTLLALLRAFRWKELFVARRQDVVARMRFALVGHGLMEKSLAPFIGLTGKAILLEVEDEASLDAAAAAWVGDAANLSSSRNLAPLPLLGIPGWDARNEAPAFYDDAGYFRSGRRAGPAKGA